MRRSYREPKFVKIYLVSVFLPEELMQTFIEIFVNISRNINGLEYVLVKQTFIEETVSKCNLGFRAFLILNI